MSTDFRNGDESSSRVRADSAIFSKISFLDTNNSCLVHDVRHVRIIFELFSTGDGTTRSTIVSPSSSIQRRRYKSDLEKERRVVFKSANMADDFGPAEITSTSYNPPMI